MSNTTDVQLLIGDVAASLFTAAQIQTFLTLSTSGGIENVYAAAALACRSLAASAVLLHKAETIGKYKLDRKSMSSMYLALAKNLQDSVTSTAAFDVAEYAHSDTIAEWIVYNDALRGG